MRNVWRGSLVLCLPLVLTGALRADDQAGSPKIQAEVAKAVTAGTVNKNAVALMDADTKALFDYSDLDAVFKNAPLLGIPPRKSDTLATYSDWVDAWNQFKAG